MRVQELGQLDGSVLLFGGPYSNLHATRALIAEAQALGIAPDHMICTGDIVAYCAGPTATVAAIRRLGCPVIAGNCEKQLANNQMDCGCGFEAGSTCDLLSAGWYAHADNAIGPADRAWMGSLPDILTFSHQGLRCAVIHGGTAEISRFIWRTSPEAVFTEEIGLLEHLAGPVDLVVTGHSGLPFQRQIGDTCWFNAGVIGMPPHDGKPQTRYAMLTAGKPRLHRLIYDHEAASAAMCDAGLIQGYHTALLSGYWPSEEVLPPELRRVARASG